MSSNEEKYNIISKIYYDPVGYGSVVNTYNDARLKDSKITIRYAQGWFSGNVINRKQPNGTNSFVAPGPYFEYQMDSFFINDLEDQDFWSGLVCVVVLINSPRSCRYRVRVGRPRPWRSYNPSKRWGGRPKLFIQTGRQ
jgi:hypothetical protein